MSPCSCSPARRLACAARLTAQNSNDDGVRPLKSKSKQEKKRRPRGTTAQARAPRPLSSTRALEARPCSVDAGCCCTARPQRARPPPFDSIPEIASSPRPRARARRGEARRGEVRRGATKQASNPGQRARRATRRRGFESPLERGAWSVDAPVRRCDAMTPMGE